MRKSLILKLIFKIKMEWMSQGDYTLHSHAVPSLDIRARHKVSGIASEGPKFIKSTIKSLKLLFLKASTSKSNA